MSVEDQTSENHTSKLPLFLAGIGLLLLVLGARYIFLANSGSHVEFVEESTTSADLASLKVDIAGAVEKPGVYTLAPNSRVQDLLVLAGGLSSQADRDWVAKHLNLAATVSDGSKIYIPEAGEAEANVTVANTGTVLANTSKATLNINSASKSELEELPGVGPVTADKIINNRPYGSIEELLSKKAVNKATFEKIKDLVSIY